MTTTTLTLSDDEADALLCSRLAAVGLNIADPDTMAALRRWWAEANIA